MKKNTRFLIVYSVLAVIFSVLFLYSHPASAQEMTVEDISNIPDLLESQVATERNNQLNICVHLVAAPSKSGKIFARAAVTRCKYSNETERFAVGAVHGNSIFVANDTDGCNLRTEIGKNDNIKYCSQGQIMWPTNQGWKVFTREPGNYTIKAAATGQRGTVAVGVNVNVPEPEPEQSLQSAPEPAPAPAPSHQINWLSFENNSEGTKTKNITAGDPVDIYLNSDFTGYTVWKVDNYTSNQKTEHNDFLFQNGKLTIKGIYTDPAQSTGLALGEHAIYLNADSSDNWIGPLTLKINQKPAPAPVAPVAAQQAVDHTFRFEVRIDDQKSENDRITIDVTPPISVAKQVYINLYAPNTLLTGKTMEWLYCEGSGCSVSINGASEKIEAPKWYLSLATGAAPDGKTGRLAQYIFPLTALKDFTPGEYKIGVKVDGQTRFVVFTIVKGGSPAPVTTTTSGRLILFTGSITNCSGGHQVSTGDGRPKVEINAYLVSSHERYGCGQGAPFSGNIQVQIIQADKSQSIYGPLEADRSNLWQNYGTKNFVNGITDFPTQDFDKGTYWFRIRRNDADRWSDSYKLQIFSEKPRLTSLNIWVSGDINLSKPNDEITVRLSGNIPLRDKMVQWYSCEGNNCSLVNAKAGDPAALNQQNGWRFEDNDKTAKLILKMSQLQHLKSDFLGLQIEIDGVKSPAIGKQIYR